MSGDAWLTLVVLAATIALLSSERFPPALVMLGSVIVLLVTDVIDADAAFAGFSNEAPFIVAALYILAGAAEATGALERVTHFVFGRRSPGEGAAAERRDVARIVVPAAAASGFIANTPLVALLAPRVVAWTRRTGRSPSRFLMPLSQASVFGGVITVLGTSTNVTVTGLLRESGREPLDLFEITPVGLPLAVLGTALIVVIAPWLLPRRLSPSEADTEASREFTLEMEVARGSTLAGRTVTDAGLRNLTGVFLLEIERDGATTTPVGPDHVLAEGDRLTFVGAVSRVLDLQRIPGLVSAEQRHFSVAATTSRASYEVVIGEGSPLVGRTLKEMGFRGRYDGAVFAIHRAGERIPSKLGEVRLRVGDLLLVLADQGFRERWENSHDFLVVSPLDGGVPVRREHALVVELTLLALIVVAGTGLLGLLETSLLAAGGLVAARIISVPEARRAIDFDVVLMIAASFGLGAAMAESGLAEELGRLLVRGSESFGDVGTLAAVLIATMLMTELLSNNAAAVIMFPIAMATASQTGLASRPFAIAILIGASCSFLTPIGYQTNLLVYGMGGYRFLDFTRFGAPLTLLTVVVSLIAIPIVFPL
ncbi:MAG: SLC13 family permease [Acidimicrobiia bacterium]